jgi:predicted NBD/HSP70 family sugar kinase
MYQLEVKDSNTRRVLKVLKEKRELTRQDIAREAGMSIPTVTNNILRLAKEGIVEEAHVLASTGGRKPQTVRFLPDGRYSIGVQVSSDHYSVESKARIVLVDLDSKILHDDIFDYRQFGSADEIMAEVFRRVDSMLKQRGIGQEKVLGIGFSLPGTVNEKKKLLKFAPNIDSSLGMNALDFKRYEKDVDFPIYIENEANAAAYAEFMSSGAEERRNLIYLSVNRGISAGIVVRGHIYKGSNKQAGEFGHMAVAREGKRCTCGNTDCLETLCRHRSPYPKLHERSDSQIFDTRGFLLALRAGDRAALSVWDSYLDSFASGLRNILLFFDPDSVVIGGEISQFRDDLSAPSRTAYSLGMGCSVKIPLIFPYHGLGKTLRFSEPRGFPFSCFTMVNAGLFSRRHNGR